MSEVIDAIRRVLPPTKQSSRGWTEFNCPICHDHRGRGRILETPTGGFRYHCFNGGCDYERPTGWEPGGAFIGRARRLFLELGGDLNDIPDDVLRGIVKTEMTRVEWIDWMMSDASAGPITIEPETAWDFPEIELPGQSVLVWGSDAPKAKQARDYVLSRGDCFTDAYPFIWSPKYPYYVLIPFLHRNKIIGWIGRRIVKDQGRKHLKCSNWPSDYMLNQDCIHQYDTVMIVQSAFDAIALKCLCTFGSKITDKQINLLKRCGKKIVMVPDYLGTEWKSYLSAAKANNWHVAIPNWGGSYLGVDHIKDPGEAIQRMGLLCTMQRLMDPDSITNDYTLAEREYSMRSRGLNDDIFTEKHTT